MFTLKYALNYIEIKNHNLGSLIPTIVAFIIHIQPLSSPLLLRNPPNTFAFIPLPAMSLSSLNRSIYAVFRHNMPYSAPLCQTLHYSKTGVPWQMKSTRIIIFSPLEMRFPAAICSDLRGVNFSLCIGHFCT